MATGTWPLGWATDDIVSAAEFAKGIGCISNTTLGADAASIDVTSIVASYAHLIVVGYLRSSVAAVGAQAFMRFNGDSGAAQYTWRDGAASGSGSTGDSAVKTGSDTTTPSSQNIVPGASATAGSYCTLFWLISHYAGTANQKSVTYLGGVGADGTGVYHSCFGGGRWLSTSAINRITVSASSGNLVTGSRLSIYAMGS